jgi:hypothetical protein
MKHRPTHVAKQPVWRNSRYISLLADHERHLGHVVKIRVEKENCRLVDVWRAFDATRANEHLTGFKCLGEFARRRAAKEAVETSSARVMKPKVMHAGS